MSTALTIHDVDGPRRAVEMAAPPTFDFPAMMEMAKTLVSTGFLPVAIKTPAQAVAIILTGRELGIAPMHALRSIHIIQGKPTLAAELQLGLFHRAGGKSKLVKSTDAECTMWFRHPNGAEHTETFTLAEAERAGLTTKQGSNWKAYPKSMLRARCIAMGLRVVAPEIVAGIYAPEELGADADDAGAFAWPHAATESTAESSTTDKLPSQRVTDLGFAMGVTVPFKNSPAYGKRLSELPSETLRSMTAWIEEKRQERVNALFHIDITDAIGLILGEREKLEAEYAASALGAQSAELDRPAVGHTGAADPTSRHARTKRINEFVKDPRCAHLRETTRSLLVNGIADHELATLEATLESLVSPKGEELALADRRPAGTDAVASGH